MPAVKQASGRLPGGSRGDPGGLPEDTPHESPKLGGNTTREKHLERSLEGSREAPRDRSKITDQAYQNLVVTEPLSQNLPGRNRGQRPVHPRPTDAPPETRWCERSATPASGFLALRASPADDEGDRDQRMMRVTALGLRVVHGPGEPAPGAPRQPAALLVVPLPMGAVERRRSTRCVSVSSSRTWCPCSPSSGAAPRQECVSLAGCYRHILAIYDHAG